MHKKCMFIMNKTLNGYYNNSNSNKDYEQYIYLKNEM